MSMSVAKYDLTDVAEGKGVVFKDVAGAGCGQWMRS